MAELDFHFLVWHRLAMRTLASRIRAARAALDLGQERLAKEAGVGLTTLRKLERNESVSSDVVVDLQIALEAHGIEFLEIGGLLGIIIPRASSEPKAAQFRAARAALSLSRDDVAKLSGVGARSIAKLENGDLEVKVRQIRAYSDALERLDVQFFDLDDRAVVMLPPRAATERQNNASGA